MTWSGSEYEPDPRINPLKGESMTKRIIAAVGLAVFALTSTGCIGSMAVSGKVREFNLNVSPEPWPREAVFFLLYMFPVYPFAGTADLLVVNSIEFWTGTNPVSGKAAQITVAQVSDTHREVAPDGTVALSTLREDGSIGLEVTAPDGSTTFMSVENTGDTLVARDAMGNEYARVSRDPF
jgi:hypothetical protein